MRRVNKTAGRQASRWITLHASFIIFLEIAPGLTLPGYQQIKREKKVELQHSIVSKITRLLFRPFLADSLLATMGSLA